MKIEYNGIVMDMLELHSYERQNVYTPDGVDLLFVRHRLNMTCTLAPGGNPWGMAVRATKGDERLTSPKRTSGFVGEKPSPQLKTVQAFGTSAAQTGAEVAPVTDRILTPLLLMPRKKLKITAYRPGKKETDPVQEVVWLESPRPGLVCDSMNGPHPLGCTLTEPTGDAPVSAALNFQIETHLPPVDVDEARALISHRWTTTLAHDEDYYATRIVNGEAVFDASLLQLEGRPPSDFLNQLYHPIPLGYQRGLPEVSLSSDGSKLEYSFTDTAVPCVFDAGETGATQCWIEEEWKYVSPHGLNGAAVEAGLPNPYSFGTDVLGGIRKIRDLFGL